MLSFTGKGIKFPALSPEGREIRVWPRPDELFVPLCSPAGEAVRLLIPAGGHVERYAPLAEGARLSVYAPFSGRVSGFVRREIAGETQLLAHLIPDSDQPEERVYASAERPDWEGLLAFAQKASILEKCSGLPLFSQLERLPALGRFAVCTADDGPDAFSSTLVLDRFFREVASAADWLSAAVGADYSFAVGNPYLKARLKSRYPDVQVCSAGRRYPVRWFLKKALGADILLLDAVALLQLFRAVAHGQPAVSSLVSVSEGAAPTVWEVPVGTPCGALFGHPLPAGKQLVLGGGMSGRLCTPETPVTPGTAAVSLLAEERPTPTDCIGCGLCCRVCPTGAYPLYLWEEALRGGFSAGYGAEGCIGCGACTYVCPARLPLARTVERAQTALREEAAHV